MGGDVTFPIEETAEVGQKVSLCGDSALGHREEDSQALGVQQELLKSAIDLLERHESALGDLEVVRTSPWVR